MAPLSKNASPADLATGALLQCLEAATLGMPFEVWKVRVWLAKRGACSFSFPSPPLPHPSYMHT